MPFTTRPGLAPAGEALFFASPKKSAQKKGDPQSGSLRCAPGNLRCSNQAGSRSNSPAAQTFASPDPLGSALLSPARTGHTKSPMPETNTKTSTRHGAYLGSSAVGISFPPRPGWAEQRRRGRIKISDVRRLRSRQVSEISVHSEQRKVPVAQRRDPDCGSPFLWLLLLAKQKKVTSRRATPGRVVKGNSYQFNSNPCPSILDQMPVFPPAPSANHRHECRTQRPSLAGKAWTQRLRVFRSLAHKRCQPLFAATAAARGRIAPPIRVIDAEVARKRPVLAFSVISCPLMRPARPLRTHLSPNR